MNHIQLETDARGVARLTLNRPNVRNAFNGELIAEITQASSDLPRDARVLVLAGAGKVFSAGADLDWMRSVANSQGEKEGDDAGRLVRMFESLDSCRVPVVGRIHGAAIAGATGLVACCDYAVAAEGTIFAFTEVRLGLVPAVISPYVVRKVGHSFARAMFLSAERFDAARAFGAGLVHRVVGGTELDAAVEETVAAVLQGGPEALLEARELLKEITGRAPADVAGYTVQAIARRRASDEGQEGMASFLEKRPPSWAANRGD